MTTTWDRLQQSFLEGHQLMTCGYRELIDLLNCRDFVGASHAASRLDTVSGPHIEFEEKYVYPRIAESRGDSSPSRLYDEHEEILAVLQKIEQTSDENPPDGQTLGGWLNTLRGAIDHSSACGLLFNELQSLTEDEQLKFLDGLTRLRQSGSRWSDLHCQPHE